MTAINVPVVTTRRLRMRVTSVLVNMCAAPYIAVGTAVGEPLAQGGPVSVLLGWTGSGSGGRGA